ncbi:hypothetical protein SOCEGT47_010210 [Sorangium cellulosum]|uniref:DUF2169 domain-containing protein n=1 Tax=Sorangium cellulosum TaxID=56 RepID=A0A4P2PV53_SORCE|nr:DUF2169 domain-containing protein [Sorangium cellulosum]AUX20549.1 hypothetical protein SOCEGT47_010210 [Sorangium cellulosum]
MHVSSACPLRVASLVWQPRPGAFALTVVCKATFSLEPGLSRLAPAQEAPWEADVPWGDEPGASLWAASDLAPFKRRADVLVVGHAHAPPGERATSLVARLAVGAVDKRIEVHGPRAWTLVGRLTDAIPFAEAPLRWERAASGPDGWNPVGVPVNPAPDVRGLRRAPSLLPPGTVLRAPADAPPPAGFGPIAPSWPGRVSRLRQHAATFRHDAWAEQPLPEDINPSYFNAAPPDQQLEQLTGGERIVLAHLHPRHPQLATVLEEVIPRAALRRGDSAPQEMRLRCDTLWIDADRGICTLTWRGAVPLGHAGEDVTVVVTAERPHEELDVEDTLLAQGAPVARAGVSALAQTLDLEPRGGAAAAEPATTLAPALRAAGPSGALPFVAPSERPASAGAGAPGEGREGREGPMTAAPGTLASDTLTLGAGLVAAAPLPFQAGLVAAAPLPFQAAPAPAAAPASAPGPAPAPSVDAPEQRSPRVTPPPPPFLGQLLSRLAGEAAEERAEAPRAEAAPAEAPRAEAPPAEAPRVESPRAEALRVEPSPAEAPPPEATPSPEPAVRPEDVTVERFAAISAEIAEQRAPRAEVLRAHGIRERDWAAVERHVRALLDRDARAGGKLRAAHDAAYVAAVEGFRGPIGLPEYARIAVGLERGAAGDVLDALAIQRAALMPIVRVWTKKAASQPALSAELMALLEELRAG